MRRYFALAAEVLSLVSIRRPELLISVYPWVASSEEGMGDLIAAVDDSPFDSVLVIDPKTGSPVFTLTSNVEAVKKCKRRSGPTNEEIFSCEQNCRSANPDCSVLIVVVSPGRCECICDNTDVMETQGGEFWGGYGG